MNVLTPKSLILNFNDFLNQKLLCNETFYDEILNMDLSENYPIYKMIILKYLSYFKVLKVLKNDKFNIFLNSYNFDFNGVISEFEKVDKITFDNPEIDRIMKTCLMCIDSISYYYFNYIRLNENNINVSSQTFNKKVKYIEQTEIVSESVSKLKITGENDINLYNFKKEEYTLSELEPETLTISEIIQKSKETNSRLTIKLTSRTLNDNKLLNELSNGILEIECRNYLELYILINYISSSLIFNILEITSTIQTTYQDEELHQVNSGFVYLGTHEYSRVLYYVPDIPFIIITQLGLNENNTFISLKNGIDKSKINNVKIDYSREQREVKESKEVKEFKPVKPIKEFKEFKPIGNFRRFYKPEDETVEFEIHIIKKNKNPLLNECLKEQKKLNNMKKKKVNKDLIKEQNKKVKELWSKLNDK